MKLPMLMQDQKAKITQPKISVIIPIYNEVESLEHLIRRISDTLDETHVSYEIICVDDGSVDGTTDLLRKQVDLYPQLRGVVLRRNYGQTAAMSAGFNHAQGEIFVTLDGDLQNEPADIPLLLDKMNEGFDLVSGWRKERQDAALTRLLPSKIANLMIGWITGVKLNDYGCSLKAYRAELIADMNLYGELHRFLPALAFIEGARIAELPVRHHARQFGQSKYGLDRTFRVVMDLLTVSFMKTFLTRPMHVFGLLGITFTGLGVLTGGYLVFLKYGLNEGIADRPLLILSAVLLLTGIQLFSIGLLAELLMRTYHESQSRPIYRVREVVQANSEH